MPSLTLPSLRPAHRDPWWDLEGKAARHKRLRDRIVGASAFVVALAACGLTAAAWVRLIGPEIVARLH